MVTLICYLRNTIIGIITLFSTNQNAAMFSYMHVYNYYFNLQSYIFPGHIHANNRNIYDKYLYIILQHRAIYKYN